MAGSNVGEQREPLVKARQVSVRLGQRSVLESVDLEVHAGEIVTLVGLNGAGKSTLVRTLLGILQPDEGTVERQADLRVGYSPQRIRRDPILPITVRRFLTIGTRFAPERLVAVLDEVGASTILDHPVPSLSAENCTGLWPRAAPKPGLSCWTNRSQGRYAARRTHS